MWRPRKKDATLAEMFVSIEMQTSAFEINYTNAMNISQFNFSYMIYAHSLHQSHGRIVYT